MHQIKILKLKLWKQKKKDSDVKNYLLYEGKSLAEAMDEFNSLELDGALPLNYRGSFSEGSKSANPQNRVHFLYELTPGTEITDYSKITISFVWIENPELMNTLINQATNYDIDSYFININGIDYNFYASSDFLVPMGLHIEKSTEATTAPPPSNSYNIYVSGNTEIARLAGNTLIEKANWCGWHDNSYGYVLTYGKSNSDGTFDTYSNISVAVNEAPDRPNTGQIILNATRCTNNIYYPLQIMVDWYATDYGDYYSFTWTNTDING